MQNNDKQIIHNLWWLNKFLKRDFKGKEYKEIIHEDLSTDVCKELDSLVEHIKKNY